MILQKKGNYDVLDAIETFLEFGPKDVGSSSYTRD